MTTDRDQAERLIAAVNEAMQPVTYRDDTPLPTTGTTPPVAQPGRPPMSQRATDASALMLAAGIASIPIGGATALVLYTLDHVDPGVLAIGAAGPVAFVLAVGALIRSVGRSMQGVHTEHHHHYNGPVSQQHKTVSTQTKGLFAKTINKK